MSWMWPYNYARKAKGNENNKKNYNYINLLNKLTEIN